MFALFKKLSFLTLPTPPPSTWHISFRLGIRSFINDASNWHFYFHNALLSTNPIEYAWNKSTLSVHHQVDWQSYFQICYGSKVDGRVSLSLLYIKTPLRTYFSSSLPIHNTFQFPALLPSSIKSTPHCCNISTWILMLRMG